MIENCLNRYVMCTIYYYLNSCLVYIMFIQDKVIYASRMKQKEKKNFIRVLPENNTEIILYAMKSINSNHPFGCHSNRFL